MEPRRGGARRIFASSPSWTVSLKTLFLSGNFPSEHLLNVLMIKSQFWRRGSFSQYYLLPSPSCYLLRRGVGMLQPNLRTQFTKLSLRLSLGNINNFYCQIIAVPAFASSLSWTVSLTILFLSGNFSSEHFLNVPIIEFQSSRRHFFAVLFCLASPSCCLY